jgi:hypothetical protein
MQARQATPADLKSALAVTAVIPRNTPNNPLKEVMAQAEVTDAWPEVAVKLAQGAPETPTFLEQMARDKVLKRK